MTARGHEAEGDSGCRAATDTVPSYLHAAVEAETREEVQERLALRTCERGHDPFLSRREQRFQAPPQPGASSSKHTRPTIARINATID